MSAVSVVIISLNEGESLRLTVDNMLATLPPDSEIIVVDDGSTDGSAEFLKAGDRGGHAVKLLRPSHRLGVPAARNFGAAQARGDLLIFSDAHVIAPGGWCEALTELLGRPEIGAVAPAVSMMQPGGAAGYGQKWSDASLAVEWLGRQSAEPYPVPLLCGCFLAMRREVFEATGGFDAGMILWGAEDSELSIRLWTLGYECWVAPGVEVQHAFRSQFPYKVKWGPVLHNRLRLATVHFGPGRLARVLHKLKQHEEFAEACARLMGGGLADQLSTVRARRQFDDDWFFERFATELNSDLAGDALAAEGSLNREAAKRAFWLATQPLPREPVTACLVSWKRPQNMLKIVRALRNLEFIDEILIWNNNPEIILEIQDSRTRVIQSDRNLGCYGRFACAAQARNQVVYVQDDDALNNDIPGLYRQFADHPDGVAHSLAPSHWGERHRQMYGDAHSALIGWGAFFQKAWLSVLDELPLSIREDSLFQREADKFFTMLLERRHTALPGDITHLDGHSTPGIALWLDASRHQKSSLAIRWALQLLRNRKDAETPPQWTVVIPCYNYGNYLAEAVESVLTNDADYEICIVDDAGTDGTERVAAKFINEHPHIYYLRNDERRGTAHSRNRGIAALDSQFVVLVDADDRIGPGYLFAAERKLANGADVVNPDAVLFGSRQDRWNVPDATTLQMLLQRNSVHCASAFRRQLWCQTGGFDEQLSNWEDYEFWIRVAAAGAKIRGLHGDHFFYRAHAGSKSETSNRIRADLKKYIREKHAALYDKFRVPNSA